MPIILYKFVDTQDLPECVMIPPIMEPNSHLKQSTVTSDQSVSAVIFGNSLSAEHHFLKPPNNRQGNLSSTEKTEFEQCERVLKRGLYTFLEVGTALMRIKDGKLYRAQYSTFEDYCRERWEIGRSYAWRVIGATERVNLLKGTEITQTPINESQIRPFLRLKAEAFPEAWARALKKAKGGKITPELALQVVSKMSHCKSKKPSAKRKYETKLAFGETLTLLATLKEQIEKHQTSDAIETLKALEDLLIR